MNKKNTTERKRQLGIFGYVFTSYERLTESWHNSAGCKLTYRATSSKLLAAVRKSAARSSERSLILGAVRRFIALLPSVTLRSYGMLIFSLGFYSSLVCIIKALASTLETDVDALVFGGMLILVSLPLLFSKKTLSEAVLESGIGSFVAFDLLGYRPEAAIACKRTVNRLDVPMIVGMVLGLCSFYFSISGIVSVLLCAVGAYFIMTVPEGGAAVLAALAPLMTERTAKAYIFVLLFGYLCKLATGRRAFKLDLADAVMLVFASSVLLGDIIHYGNGSELEFGSHFAALSVYFLIVNLVRSDRWREIFRASVVCGGVLTAALAIAERYLYGRVAALSFSSESLEGTKKLILSLMDASDGAILYTAAVLPMICISVSARNVNRSGTAALCAAITVASVVISGSRSLWLGSAVGIAVLLIFVNFRLAVIPAAVAAAIPIAVLILPDRLDIYIKRLFDISGEGAVSNINVRENSLSMLLDSFVGGIGSADGMFSSYYAAYTGTGFTPANAKNLFLGVAVALGVTGFIAFAAALIFLCIKLYTYASKSSSGDAKAVLAGFVSFVCVGLTVDIFADFRLFLLFFVYAAFASSYSDVRPTRDGMTDKLAVSSARFATRDIEFD